MNKVLLSFLLVLVAEGVSFGQSTGTPEEKADYLTDVLIAEDINLSADQLEKVREANLEMFTRIAKEEASGGSLRTIREFIIERNKKLSQILSAEQMKVFQANMRDYQVKIDKKFGR